jgi:hypothetical protein
MRRSISSSFETPVFAFGYAGLLRMRSHSCVAAFGSQ